MGGLWAADDMSRLNPATTRHMILLSEAQTPDVTLRWLLTDIERVNGAIRTGTAMLAAGIPTDIMGDGANPANANKGHCVLLMFC